MRLNHQDLVLNFEGQPLKEPDETGDGVREVTFRSLALAALNGMADGEHMGGEDKARCFNISNKFFHGKFVKLTVDEAAFIKRRAGVVLIPIGYGRLAEWLEGNPQTVASDDTDEDDAGDSTAEGDE